MVRMTLVSWKTTLHLGEGGRRGLGRKTGGVLQEKGLKQNLWNLFLIQTLQFIYNSVQCKQLLIAELTSKPSCF